MILIAVDDLMLRSRIQTAARATAVPLAFASTAREVLEHAASGDISFIIFDLNSRAIDPISTIAALKTDEGLRHIHTLGFVSHVDSETMAAARAAGSDDVMARGAFMSHLPELLQAANRPAPDEATDK